MKISAEYFSEDYQRLDFSEEDHWQQAINLLKDRIESRFLNPIDNIRKMNYAGFAVMALDCLLIETLQQFRKGVPETELNMGKTYFKEFLTDTSFGEYFNERMANQFYDHVRNGILHQAETKGNTLIKIGNYPLASPTEDNRGLIINRNAFHERLVIEFEKYLENLRSGEHPLLRDNFRIKMDHVCRIIHNERLNRIYFAYGANMSKKILEKRKIKFEVFKTGYILNMKLLFNKKSIDGSAKANIMRSEGDQVWGVLYRISDRSIHILDNIEGNYQREKIKVQINSHTSVQAETYVSNHITPDQRAFNDYKKDIISGAIEHNLPNDYVKYLKQLPTKSSDNKAINA